MYNRTNRAALIAQIGAINRPKITEGKSIDFSGAVDSFIQGREQAERRAKEQEQKNRVNAWINQLNGDETLSDTEKAYFTANPDAYGQRMANNLDFERKKELAGMNFENALALENIKNRNAIGLKQLEYQGLGNIEGFTPTGNPAYDKAVVAQLAKDNVERQKAIRQVEDMRPAVVGALARADQALLSGKGIGANSAKGMFGDDSVLGQFFSSKEADNNREDINTANSQMNSFLRSKLASTGLTGGELNAAAEAEAYRYTIKPNDSDTSIARKISNFRRDYLELPELNIPASAKPQTSGAQQVGNFKVREIK